MGLRGIGAKPLALRFRNREALKQPNPWDKPGLTRAERVMAFCADLTITSGKDASSRLWLRRFQRQFIEAVYREHRGSRPIRTAILSMGRKNGKTQLAAALALCHLCGPEAESRGEIYSCANDRFQAGKIFNEMVALIDHHPWLAARCNIISFQKNIIDLENGSIYSALSSEARTKMGLNPSFVVYDELGQAPNRELYDAMDSAMGARENPLLLVISTQAADDFAPMSQLIDYGLRVKAGDIKDASFYLSLYCAPEDANPWTRKAWAAANPALDDFRSLADVKRLAQQAQRMPAQENAFRNLILNQRVAAHARFIERSEWMACAGPTAIPLGSRVYAAVDLGATRDMSALVLVHQDIDGVFHVQPHYWLPGNVQERVDQDRVPYDVWIRDGLVYHAGDTTDPEAVAIKIAELNGQYRIMTLAFDAWRIADLKRELDGIGCNVQLVPHGQGFKDMSPAVNILERLVVQKRIRHGGHPVLTWNAANAVITRAPTGDRKLDKAKSSGRIDGLVALAMAFSLALIKNDKPVDIEALIG